MIPPMGQASLGIEIVQGNEKLQEISDFLNDNDTNVCTQIERDFIAAIGAGCSAPVACNAVKEDDTITFHVMLGFPDGTRIMERCKSFDIKESSGVGKMVAYEMIEDGALELLKEAEKVAFKDEMPQRI